MSSTETPTRDDLLPNRVSDLPAEFVREAVKHYARVGFCPTCGVNVLTAAPTMDIGHEAATGACMYCGTTTESPHPE